MARTALAVLVAGATALVAVAPAAAGELDPTARRGKEIYLHGRAPGGGEVTALMGDDAIEVPATALPCGNCHGLDGRGRPEGGVSPSDLTWEALTKPYGVRHPSGREHPPYDEKLLKRAITLGVDPAGNPLHVAMPRYRMAHQDLEALVAYLRQIADDRDPGIGDRRLVLGVLLPPRGSLAPIATALSTVLDAYFGRLNERGGVYGREIAVEYFELPPDPERHAAAVGAFLDEHEIFALAPSFIAGSDAALAELARERELPMIAPFTLEAEEAFPVNRQVFYLWSGIAGQGRALAEHAAGEAGDDGPPPAAVVHPVDRRLGALAAELAGDLGDAGWQVSVHPLRGGDAAALADELAAAGVAELFLLDGGAGGAALLAAAAERGWRPRVLVPGSLAGGALFAAPPVFDRRIVLAYPTLPGDRSDKTLGEFRELLGETELPPGQDTVALAAFAGVRLLVDGLKEAGREVSRERLISALEGLYDHPTGLTPRLSYGPNRRVGARGAYLVAVDLAAGQAVAAGGWVEVDR